jgi:hypothetical protein
MERQPWQDPWQNLNFLRGKLANRHVGDTACSKAGSGNLAPRWQDKPENRAIDPVFTEADKIAARGMGVQL